ncbi:MAG: hypothetical protein RBR05_03935 [Candidatus Methanomethylophilaceae archaeon]|nr:hypothetical protein [Candidatus Methanomethylophilaceae archaeon]MDY0224532.1 hypothetical protein [Candidatus Methanomethylophilaceae archaeon]
MVEIQLSKKDIIGVEIQEQTTSSNKNKSGKMTIYSKMENGKFSKVICGTSNIAYDGHSSEVNKPFCCEFDSVIEDLVKFNRSGILLIFKNGNFVIKYNKGVYTAYIEDRVPIQSCIWNWNDFLNKDSVTLNFQ